MESSLRWIGIAAVLGFCTAYALWGSGSSSNSEHKPAPPSATPDKSQNPQAENKAQHPVEVPPKGSAPDPVEKAPPSALKFEPENFDFGEVIVDESKTLTARLKNPTDKKINITRKKGSCGCLLIQMTDNSIDPGQSVPVSITFTGQPGKRPENYSFTVRTDEPGDPAAVLPIHGKVKEFFNLEPVVLYFDAVPKGQSKTMETTLREIEGHPFKIITAAAVNKEFSVTWEPLGPENNAYKITVKATGIQAGAVSEPIGIIIEHPKIKAVKLHVSARITGEVVSSIPVLTTTQAPDGTVNPLETTIKRATSGPMEISSVTDANGNKIEYKLTRINESTQQLRVEFKAVPKTQDGLGEFLVQTDVEKDPLRVPYRIIRRGPQIIHNPPVPVLPKK